MYAADPTPAQTTWANLDLSDDDRGAILSSVSWQNIEVANTNAAAAGQLHIFKNQVAAFLKTARTGNVSCGSLPKTPLLQEVFPFFKPKNKSSCPPDLSFPGQASVCGPHKKKLTDRKHCRYC